jgi:hypothetical protein
MSKQIAVWHIQESGFTSPIVLLLTVQAIVGRTERVEQRLHQLSVKHKKFDSTAAGRTFQRWISMYNYWLQI